MITQIKRTGVISSFLLLLVPTIVFAAAPTTNFAGTYCDVSGSITRTIGLDNAGNAQFQAKIYGSGTAPCALDPNYNPPIGAPMSGTYAIYNNGTTNVQQINLSFSGAGSSVGHYQFDSSNNVTVLNIGSGSLTGTYTKQ